ncbi:hypothetical protein CHI12_13460 [Terribacillus saccharophilus]|jgi:hypothetical protein|uniref:Uncharacterized protein n=1 Tax=Terribacillus saccharophilus TaxID=361277 RepID=A0A268HAY1_9BACI|nr:MULTISPECIES: hypothetical protein [Terribacillus]PAD34082.1 hypothetical protein CHH56_16135 [Terribacillus saccharophilus]PAD97952.1 hypothetical protein CHH50_00495 [Terribacillus saccharophilus]PAE01728.1 hypothetical protein CHH48_00490 [Terribacillus saccharophilus]PAE07014.1 hypothetical protein CHI12_13460 [Terribacillus saccharophilus]
MRNNIFALYNGTEYAAGIKADGRIILRSERFTDELFEFDKKTIADNTIYISMSIKMKSNKFIRNG